jgi:hypothetical protein
VHAGRLAVLFRDHLDSTWRGALQHDVLMTASGLCATAPVGGSHSYHWQMN